MKTLAGNKSRGAFTVTEILVAMAIFALLIAGILSAQLFGLRMHRISSAKLSCTGSARSALNRVRDEVRASTLLYIGNADANSFQLLGGNLPRTGNALKICPTSNTNSYICYYQDAETECLMRYLVLDQKAGQPELIARYVTNQIVFQAEDFQGNVVTNNQNNRMIRMNLEYSQVEFPTDGGTHADYRESYRVQTRITRRAL